MVFAHENPSRKVDICTRTRTIILVEARMTADMCSGDIAAYPVNQSNR